MTQNTNISIFYDNDYETPSTASNLVRENTPLAWTEFYSTLTYIF